MENKSHKLGILAFGSLINDPGSELKDCITKRKENVDTPFKIEYGRKSSGRGDAPTLIPIQEGGAKVKATLLILSDDTDIDEAKNMLYRREINQVGSDKTYTERSNPEPDQLVIGEYFEIGDVKTVLTANFGSNLNEITSEILADLAIKSYNSDNVETGRDGICYLKSNIDNGIITPLTEDYKKSVLKKMKADSLEDILERK